jgi:ubiquinone/menaquinone biosynthesis C-methylase UbiE
MGQAADRWRGLVEGRLAEMEQLQEGRGTLDGEFWDKRAKRFGRGPMATADGDPMVARLRRAVGRPGRATVLDVGAGPGRFTVAIAPHAARVTAVDPSRKMLQMLRRRAREAGLSNVKTVHGRWQDVDVPPADVVLCSHVLPLIPDAAGFVEKLQAAARTRVLLYIGAYAADGYMDPFWRHFHGKPRRPGGTYLDALAVIEEMGIRPQVEVVELPVRTRYDTVADAVENYLDQLVLPDTPDTRAELTRLVEPWLQPRKGGLSPPFRTQPAAILSWRPS